MIYWLAICRFSPTSHGNLTGTVVIILCQWNNSNDLSIAWTSLKLQYHHPKTNKNLSWWNKTYNICYNLPQYLFLPSQYSIQAQNKPKTRHCPNTRPISYSLPYSSCCYTIYFNVRIACNRHLCLETPLISILTYVSWPLTRYVKLRVAHASV